MIEKNIPAIIYWNTAYKPNDLLQYDLELFNSARKLNYQSILQREECIDQYFPLKITLNLCQWTVLIHLTYSLHADNNLIIAYDVQKAAITTMVLKQFKNL